MEEGKTIKQYCKEAKKRMKQGFWQDYKKNLDEEIRRGEEKGIAAARIKEYYSEKAREDIKNSGEDKEDFYKKVKNLLDSEGEVSDAIGRLTDKKYYDTLSYEEKQRYTLSLSEKYLQAVEKYKKEKSISL
ncbi:MAG: hypothetical protein SPJ19_00760 [Candidatus Borkfalkiaceae bacterium]|nr:hypothetical protein [Christensenellaceae bacterium]